MKKLFALAGLLLAFATGPLLPASATARPLPVRSEAEATRPLPVIARPARPAHGPLDELPPAVVAAYYQVIGIVGLGPCDALEIALGYEAVNAPQRYAHDQLRDLGYDFPTPDPAGFDCPF